MRITLKLAIFLTVLSASASNTEDRVDYYAVLGVDKAATPKEVQSAFRKIAQKYHPDKFAQESEEVKKKVTEEFKKYLESYEVLSDAKRRAEYDQYGTVAEDYLEQLAREGKLDFYSAMAWSQRQWERRAHATGTDYEAAKVAFSTNSYYASEQVGQYQLNQNQLYEFAKISARNSGAVFTKLMKNFPIQNPQRRFNVGMIAARYNVWGNVKFEIREFGLEKYPELEFKLIKTAVFRSREQIKYIAEWNLNAEQLKEVIFLSAQKHGSEALPLLKLTPLTQKERLEILKLCTLKDWDSALNSFNSFGITDANLRYEAQKYLAARGASFGEHLSALQITDRKQILELAELDFAAKYTSAHEHIGKGKYDLDDQQILNFYFKYLRPKDQGRFGFDPLRFLRGLGGPYTNYFYGYGREDERPYQVFIHEGKKVKKPLAEDKSLDDLLAFSEQHLVLLPPAWVKIAMNSGLSNELSTQLIRSAYRISNETGLIRFSSAWELICRASGIPCEGSIEPNISSELRSELYFNLLSLHSLTALPPFLSVPVDVKLLQPENIPQFINFIQAMQKKVFRLVQEKYYNSNEAFLKIVARHQLERRGITLGNLVVLTQSLAPKPNAARCDELLVMDGRL